LDTHHATVNDIGSTYVDMTIASNPIHFRLFKDTTRDVDVNGDGTNDLSVTLLGLTNGKAQLVFKDLNVTNRAKNSNVAVALPSRTSTTSKHNPWGVIGLSIAIVVVGSLIVIRLRNRAA
jgi:hypothetical protein